jgi:hypothetical protein
LRVSPRPLALVSGLTVGDYFLWSWSLNGNHDVLALIAGLSLPPLIVATLWLMALSLAGLLTRIISRPAARSTGKHQRRRIRRRHPRPSPASMRDEHAATAAQARADARKLAA